MDSADTSQDGDAEMVDEIEAEMRRQAEEEGEEMDEDHDSEGDNSQNDDQDGGSDDDNEEAGREPMDMSTSGAASGSQQNARNISILHNPPPYVASMRQALFDIKQPVELKPEEFEMYWPFVDNVWVRQHKAGVDRAGRNTDYYACRLQRPTYAPKRDSLRPEGKQRRVKQTRQGGTCQMRIKTVRYEGDVKKVTISRIGEHSHSHDLDSMDKLKRNTVVMEIARSEVMKGFMPASVFTVMNTDPYKLSTIGGKFMKTNDVRNSSQTWRQNYQGKLAVHPGYKYDHGNGIIADAQRAQAFSAAIDPTLQPPVPIPNSFPGHPPILPPDTLHFPPPTASLFVPYLPPPVTPPPPNDLPHVTLTYATSMDSFLSLSPTVPTAISGPGTKSMTHFLRSHHSAILVGVGTAIADDPALNCRLAGAGGYGGLGWTSHPRPVIIDPGARWDLRADSKILQAVKSGRGRAPWVIVAPGIQIPPARVELLRAHGGKYVALPDFDPRFRLRWEGILRALKEEGINSVMIEGGAFVINEMLGREENRKLINSIIVTVAPVYLGAGSVTVAPNRKYDGSGRPIPVCRFRNVRWYPFGDDVVMLGHLEPGDGLSGPSQQQLQGAPLPPVPPGSATVPVETPGGGIPNSPMPPPSHAPTAAMVSTPAQTPGRVIAPAEPRRQPPMSEDAGIEAAHRQLQQQLQQHALQAQQAQQTQNLTHSSPSLAPRRSPAQANGTLLQRGGRKTQNIRWTEPKGPHI